MSGPGPELSSMTSTLEDLLRRVAAMAEASAASEEEKPAPGSGPSGEGTSGPRRLSQELFEIERSLGEALRRLVALHATLPEG